LETMDGIRYNRIFMLLSLLMRDPVLVLFAPSMRNETMRRVVLRYAVRPLYCLDQGCSVPHYAGR
jgi:hypothetical protein